MAKLQKHLSLLRQEYVKLQSKMFEMESKLSLASAASGDLKEDNFISQLLRLVADLYDKDSFRCVAFWLQGYFTFVVAAQKGLKMFCFGPHQSWAVVVPQGRGLGGFVPPNPKNGQKIMKKNGRKLFGYVFRLRNYIKILPPPHFS